MKVSCKWLADFVAIPWKPEELADRLTMAGIEIESVVRQDAGLDQVVVAEILKSGPHPDADRLSVCEVSIGAKKHQIVCGAKNYKVGDRVPLALPGARLPNGLEIKAAKLRGVPSEGMLCSAAELGLAADALASPAKPGGEGLLILSKDARVGAPFAEAYGLDDTIIDVEITPNRPDLLSHLGIAREIATLAGVTLKIPLLYDGKPSGKETFAVQIKDPALCPRYSARILRKVKVGPSPEWMQRRLIAVGQRPINNVVDITNYVMLEVGQPLHAFDTRLLYGGKIVVRRADPSEKIRTLDEQDLNLDADTLVIADGKHPVALAGVMGGIHSGIGDDTTEILLESATFQPSNIRRTSKKFQIRSESSYRFERGVDPLLAAFASDRATRLLAELAGAEPAGPLHMIEPSPPSPRRVPVRLSMIRRMAGIDLPEKEIEKVFDGLGFRVTEREKEKSGMSIIDSGHTTTQWMLEVPSHRLDVVEEVDVLEEIVRVYGIEKLPANPVAARWIPLEEPGRYFEMERVRRLTAALGFDEVQNYTLVSSKEAQAIHGAAFPEDQRLANPLTDELDALRADLFLGMLGVIARNHAQRNLSLRLSEVGRVFEGQKESTHLALALTGDAAATGWEGPARAQDFFDLKGALTDLLEKLGARDLSWRPASHAAFSLFVELYRGDEEVGFAGQVSSRLTRGKKIEGNVYYAEMDLDLLLKAPPEPQKFAPLPGFPAVQRDLALILPEAKTFDEVFSALGQIARKAAKEKNISLESVVLFDIFRSSQLGDARKSMAFRFTYRSLEKTLTDAEVNQVHQQVTKTAVERLKCEVRE